MKRFSTLLKRKSSQQAPQQQSSSDSKPTSPAAQPTSSAKETTPPKPKATGPFLGAIDQGTTSSRFLIFDKAGVIVAQHQLEFNQYHQHSG